MQQFSFVIKHKTGQENKVVYAFSHIPHPLLLLTTNSSGMVFMKDHYNNDADFKEVWESLHINASITVADYTLIDRYLMKGDRIFVSKGSLWEFLIQELHEGGMTGHFG
jgi:hypothetical protein